MNWRKPLVIQVLKLTGSHVYDNFLKTVEISSWDKKKLKRYQEQQLKKLILHAYKHTSYYHELFKVNNVVKNGSVSFQNFKKSPLLTKKLLRTHYKRLISDDHIKRKSHINRSGGSTGEPVTFIQDKNYDEWNIANKIFYAHLHGKELGESEMKVWGSDIDIIKNTIGTLNKLKFFLYNRIFVNSFKFDLPAIKKALLLINIKQPKLLWGYVNSLEALARYKINKHINGFCPPLVFSAAGTLHESIRTLIQNAFPSSKIINVYGSREMGDMAVEEKSGGGLITFDHTHLIELLPIPKSKQKKIVVTSLTNYSMPLLRYEIGDVSTGWGSKNKTVCFNKLKDVIGRSVSLFVRSRGGFVPPEFFIHMIGVYFNKGGIQKFQVVQKAINHILIYYTGSKNLPLKPKNEIKNVIKKTMGTSCVVSFIKKHDILPLSSGKYLYAYSEVYKKLYE